MNETVGVVVATFGKDAKWERLAGKAWDSVNSQTRKVDQIRYMHSDDPDYPLGYLRNEGAAELDTDWLIFLDADDELDRFYVEKMLEGTGDVRQPSTLGIYSDGSEDEHPVLIPKKNLLEGNYIVIGALINHNAFNTVKGFREWPIYEDWDLYLRLEEAGAVFSACPNAVYRVGINVDSRNKASRVIQDRYLNVIRGEALQRRGLK